MARPTKLTPTVHKSIVESITAGVAIRTACRAVGVSDDAYRDWIKRGDDETETDPRFARFSAAIARAEHDLQSTSLSVIRADDDWRAHSDFLRRRFPNEWSEKVVQEQTGPGGGSQKVEVTLVDTDAVYRGLVDAGVIQPGPSAAADAAK